MKNLKSILFIAALSVCGLTTTTAQTQYDYLPGGGMPIVMNSVVESCFFFNFDGDPTGTNEIKIVHGLNAGCYLASATGIPIYAPTNNVNGVDLWSDCNHNNFFNWYSDTAWISKGSTRLSSGSHVLPFMYDGKIGYFVLKLTTGSDTLRVRGNKFSITKRDFECYQLIPPVNPIRNQDEAPKKYEDLNNLGQPVDEFYSGLVFRKYEDGSTKKIYR